MKNSLKQISKNTKGITLMALVITIVLLLILASISVYSGVNVVKSSRFTRFTAELKIMQTQVNDLYQKYTDGGSVDVGGNTYTGEEILNIGKDISSSQDVEDQANFVFTSGESGITDKTGYKYFDLQTIKDLNIEGVEGEFFINVQKRSIVSYDGFNYENEMYYTLDQIPNGFYNVEYEENINKPTFEVTEENWTNGKGKITVTPNEYDGYIEKWEVKYQLKGKDNWYTSEDLSFFVETPGTYIIKIVNGNIESETKEVEVVKANAPEEVTGMTAIMFNEPNGENMGSTIKLGQAGFDTNIWYDYGHKKWANTMTEDGSMWVWIPRYAYKITYNNPNDKTQGGTIDVKFLEGTTDNYYDEGGNLKTAKRVTSGAETVDTSTDYYVHPAFTNESNINYANGGWDKELTGIWVAKFEAGYASGNNNAEVKASTVNYSQASSYVAATEAGTSADTTTTARNWLDGEYGVKNSDGTYAFKNGVAPAIKYPTFQGATYSMNYINMNDAFNISRSLTEEGNIYGFNSSNSDSHLMKNSEWGAVAYLGHSEYGLNKQEVYLNNINLNNTTKSVYAVTGVTTGTTGASSKTTTIENIKAISGNSANSDGVYLWNQKEGQKASSTGNMYGIFDLSGGTWERTAGYVANGNGNLKTYGESLAYEAGTLKTTSTKYVTVYPHNEGTSGNIDTEGKNNYAVNTKIFGDAIRETSTSGIGSSGWNDDYSYFPALYAPFAERGAYYGDTSVAGLFAFYLTNGASRYSTGFRPVVVCL